MRKLLLFATLWIGGSMLEPAHAVAQGFYPGGRGIGARIWVENDRDYFRRGDRLDVRFAVYDDAYVAVIHVDTNGDLDFLFPYSPWDNEFVRRDRVISLPVRGSGWTVRGQSGIGYLYIVASPYPLDFSYFRGRNGSPWSWGHAGRVVRGDPFLAFYQIRRLLLPDWRLADFSEDFYSYYVGGIHRYPTFACSDRYFDSGWGWTPSYGRCDRLDVFLHDYPYYYDTRRFRGDRRVYLGQYDRLDPEYGFKEDPDGGARGVRRAVPRSDARGDVGRGSVNPPGSAVGVDRREPVPRGVEPSGADERRGASEPRGEPRGEPEPQARPEPSRRPQPSIGTTRPPSAEPSAPSSGRRPAIGRP